MDPGLIECCTGPTEEDIALHFSASLRGTSNTDFRGDTISARLQEIEARQREEALRKQLRDMEAKVMLSCFKCKDRLVFICEYL